MENLKKHTEFETKYKIEPSMLTEFKRIVDALPGLQKFIYVEGPDTYYTNEHIVNKFTDFSNSLKEKEKEKLLEIVNETIGSFPPFMRYRRPSHGLDNDRKELTTKYKQDSAKNNVNREEKNLRVDNTQEETIKAFVRDLGYTCNFSIWKACHIYNFEDATLVFYSVYDTTDGKASKVDNFVEIEVDEETIAGLTEDQAWSVIEKYEKILADIGISPQKRLRKSLYEIYKRN